MSDELDRATRALQQRRRDVSWVGVVVVVVGLLGAGWSLGALPLAVDASVGVVVLFAIWQGYRVGLVETLGWAASWVIPLLGAGLGAPKLDAWFGENVPLDIPFRRHVLYVALFFGLLAVVRQLFGRARGPRASGPSAALGAVLGGGLAIAALAVGLQVAAVGGLGVEGSVTSELAEEVELVQPQTIRRLGGSSLGAMAGLSAAQSEVGIFYGREALSVLAKAQEVSIRRLTRKGTRYGKYRTSGPVAALSGGALPALRVALADVDLYEFEVVSEATFAPGHALELTAGGQTLVLLLDLTSHKLGWTLKKSQAVCDIDPDSDGYEALVSLIARSGVR